MIRSRKNFWHKLADSKNSIDPFFCLAPMADVTDVAFRALFVKYGKQASPGGGPDVLWTEFVSADGLCSVGQKKLLPILAYSPKERPIVAQIFGATPENIKKASALVAELGFDGLDLNMGCPDRSVIKQGSGAAHIKNPKLAREVIRAAIAGVNSTKNKIPVSVKTRVGFSKKEELLTWVGEIIQEDISALTIHARTMKEMSLVPADWSLVKKVVDFVRAKEADSPTGKKRLLIIGNGDVQNMAMGRQRALETGCDGIMIGRGAFGKPWLFNEKSAKVFSGDSPAIIKKRLLILLEHTKLFEKKLGQYRNFAIMKKHYKAYVNGFPGAQDLRVQLMETNSYAEVRQVILAYLKK